MYLNYILQADIDFKYGASAPPNKIIGSVVCVCVCVEGGLAGGGA
jgi:hypothetical protein